jgi:NAD(P)-dependent dehydrogenase (short-subunit alcohol dehydrogenase family)
MGSYGRLRNPQLHEYDATVRSRSESNLLGNDGTSPVSSLRTEANNIGALVVETGDLPIKIRDSVAFVTGAKRGIGLAFAQELLARGARKVYATARQPERITVAAAARQCADVNLLINNAGIAFWTGFLVADSVEAARSEIETNYYGPLLLSRAFAPVLAKNGGGAIVNLLSVLSWVAVRSAGTYSASKAAAWSLTNWLRTALREQGTQVIGVHAGPVDTDMANELTLPNAKPIDVVRQVLSAVEAGRDEVLADDMTRQVKAGLSDRKGIYLNFDPESAMQTAR